MKGTNIYGEPLKVMYLCDGEVPECKKNFCYKNNDRKKYPGVPLCMHTSDPDHALNFESSPHTGKGRWEKPPATSEFYSKYYELVEKYDGATVRGGEKMEDAEGITRIVANLEKHIADMEKRLQSLEERLEPQKLIIDDEIIKKMSSELVKEAKAIRLRSKGQNHTED